MEATAPDYYARDKKGSDLFVVDDLLALPCDDEEEEEEGVGDAPFLPANAASAAAVVVKQEAGFGNASADSSTVTALDSCSNSFSGLADGDFSGGLCEPALPGGGAVGGN
ncbi:hypothetical protein TRIUR3_33186 [Triticum urartu]|uniref:Uncharacterized protein n=1 Tax=Triticum urartu TaxID=4572 RepID=M7Z2S1_TRIUA|nr:hypothetical protein TRIUR3_33186 [Triticum urartu]